MIHPTRDFVLVEVIEAEVKTASGIYIGHVATDKTCKAKVLAVGSGKVASDGSIVPLEIKVDDVVIFTKSLGAEVADGDKKYYLVTEECVMATVV